jgi:peptidoglycan/LPS O-acetylase OafA/YrhL
MKKTIDQQISMGEKINRIVGLDLLRIALAILIYMFHSRMYFKCSYYFLNDFVDVGSIAMTGFMMLSGFVLFYTYSRRDFTQISEIRSFYIKRLISILPLYYTIALIHVLDQTISGQISFTDVAVLFPVEFFSVQSTYFSLFSYSHNGGTWFISCILICYAVYPYLQFLTSNISNKSRKRILLLIIVLLLYAPIVRLYFNLDSTSIYTNPFYRLLEFWIGVILAQFVSSGHQAKMSSIIKTPISLIVTVLIMIISISVVRHHYAIDHLLSTWIALPCFIIIVIILAYTPFKSIQHSSLIKYSSSIAFTFYLCQVLPLWRSATRFVCDSLESDNNLLKVVTSFMFCLVGAVIIHEIIEKPASKYLKKLLLKQK